MSTCAKTSGMTSGRVLNRVIVSILYRVREARRCFERDAMRKNAPLLSASYEAERHIGAPS
jgi:hypothetical protein